MRRINCFIISLVIISITSCVNKPKQEASGQVSIKETDSVVSVYEQKDYNDNLSYSEQKDYNVAEYNLSYPSDWEFKEGLNGAEFFILSPLTSAEDEFSDNVNLIIEPVTPNINLDAYVNAALKIIDSKRFKIIKKEKYKENGLEYFKVALNGGGDYYIEQRIFVKNNKAFTLTKTYKDIESKNVKTKLENIMKSFKLK